MSWNISWDGTSWNLDDDEVPDKLDTKPTIGGGGLRRKYSGDTSISERWRALSVSMGWTGIGSDLYGTLSTLTDYSGAVTVTCSDPAIGTQTGRIDPATVKETPHGYLAYDVSFWFVGNP